MVMWLLKHFMEKITCGILFIDDYNKEFKRPTTSYVEFTRRDLCCQKQLTTDHFYEMNFLL